MAAFCVTIYSVYKKVIRGKVTFPALQVTSRVRSELSPQQVDYTRGKKKGIIKPPGNHCVTNPAAPTKFIFPPGFTRARSIINQTHAIFQLPPRERCADAPPRQLRNFYSSILHRLRNLARYKAHVQL